MKKLYLLLLLSVIYVWNVNAQSPPWLWEKSAGGTSDDYGAAIFTDANGNVLVTGAFASDSITFGTTTLYNSNANYHDVFVVKYDSSGNVLWAESANGTSAEGGTGITVDGNGNVLLTGFFAGPVISFGSNVLFNSGTNTRDIFLVKYDASGNILWAKSAGGTGNDETSGISTDGNGNIFVTGYFASPAITFGTDTLTLTSANYTDMFVVKYDASGNTLWAQSTSGIYAEYCKGICTDGNGNVVLTGYFTSPSIIFGQDTLNISYNGYPDMFIVKYDDSGNALWAKSAGGYYAEGGYGIATDGIGNVLVTGLAESYLITFGTDTLVNTGFSSTADIFVTKYDASGNVLWAKSASGDYSDEGHGISADGSGNAYVTGFFTSDSITFGTTTLVNTMSGNDIFVVKYDASGNVLWAKSAGGTNDDYSSGISADASENVLVTGSFNSHYFTFATDTLVGNFGTSFDFYVAKIQGTNLTGIAEENTTLYPIKVFPNPNNGQFKIASAEKMDEIKITNLTGQLIYHTYPDEKNISLQFDEAGMYFIQILRKDQIITKKIIVSR